MRIRYSIIFYWLPFAVLATIFCGLVYAVVQQDMRQGANDPQIALAQDYAIELSKGTLPSQILGTTKIDIEKSLSPFVIIYDEAGKVLGSNGYLNNEVPVLPKGVFDFTKSNDEDRLTWQPSSNVRVAAVVKHFEKGYVVAARSLREVEERESFALYASVAAWLAALVITFIICAYTIAEKSARENEEEML